MDITELKLIINELIERIEKIEKQLLLFTQPNTYRGQTMEPTTQLFNSQDLWKMAEDIKRQECGIGWNDRIAMIQDALQKVQDNARKWAEGITTVV